MRLRLILLVLSLLALLSAAGGGLLYYLTLREAAFRETRSLAISRAEMVRQHIAFTLSEHVKPVRTLAGLPSLAAALATPQSDSLEQANRMLDHFTAALAIEVCYLIDTRGMTIATSNRLASDSFLGHEFAFRPYFRQAMQGGTAVYLALGTTSRRRGVYTSHPVLDAATGLCLGVVVIKASIERIEKDLLLDRDEEVMVTNPRGIIFVASRPERLLQALGHLADDDTRRVRDSLQFGAGPWPWTGLTIHPGNHAAVDREGKAYRVYMAELNNFPGWQMIHLQSQKALDRSLAAPFIRIVGPLILALWLLIGVSVGIFYRKASREIRKRQTAEDALRESEARYRSIYHNAPAMLHSVDVSGCLVSVSEHWLRALGYTQEEVIGQPIVRFLDPASAAFAAGTVMPAFFQEGACTDIPYRFVRKNGEAMDVLLSAIGERDGEGRVIRSLSVSIDITERLRMEAALQQAKDTLSRYSRDLERQVQQRTEEITRILHYTPNMVAITDTEGRYGLVNPRYEELFGVKREAIRGKRMHEAIPPALASEFQAGDRKVLATRQPLQVEHLIPLPDGTRTFLSVKFPVYDETGAISGVGSIFTDITALKKAQDKLRRLSANVIASQERERTAIARELHDELGQMLTALRMEAVWLQKRLQNADEKIVERIQAMCDLIDTTIEDVRGIAIRLRPGVLDNLGLADALEWYTGDFEHRTGVPCVFECGELPPLTNPLATVAYRIAQESLTNVARHAAATRVEVTLRLAGHSVELTIRDDGRGFDPGRLKDAETLGLAGMQERASLVGGELTIESRPGGGTRVRFRLPIREGEIG